VKTRRIIAPATLIVASGLALLTSCAQESGTKPTDRPAASTAGGTRGATPRETVTVIADKPIPNLPGKRLVSHLVEYPPGGVSVPHRHGRSAFIYAYVLSGAIRSQADDEPIRVYRAGEQWFENPGAYHRVSVNASATEPARLLAVFIADVAEEQLTIPDAP
jgi:quercetin dioxygenase-like cupin family protein